jgi:hypothetical protein
MMEKGVVWTIAFFMFLTVFIVPAHAFNFTSNNTSNTTPVTGGYCPEGVDVSAIDDQAYCSCEGNLSGLPADRQWENGDTDHCEWTNDWLKTMTGCYCWNQKEEMAAYNKCGDDVSQIQLAYISAEGIANLKNPTKYLTLNCPQGTQCAINPKILTFSGTSAYCKAIPGYIHEDTPEKCNNGIDDDENGLIDMKDPGCFNIASDNGGCPSTNYGPIPAPITNETSFVQFPWFNASAKSALDGCCGDDFESDVGSTDPSGRYVCYNNFSTARPNDNAQWFWIDAQRAPGTIYTLDFSRQKLLDALNGNIGNVYDAKTNTITPSNHTIDVVSNANEWYFCNATSISTPLTLKPIQEYNTFSRATANGNILCSYALSNIFDEYIIDSPECGKSLTYGCCRLLSNGEPAYARIDSIDACNGYCYLQNSTPVEDICETHPEACNAQAPVDNIGTSDTVDKSSCPRRDITGCVNDTRPQKSLSCSAQDPSAALCADTANYYCSGGSFIETNESGNVGQWGCCYGSSAQCTRKQQIFDAQKCSDLGGAPYSPQLYACLPSMNDAALTDGSGLHCCFNNALTPLASFDFSWYRKVSPEAFICSKQEGNNLVTQCVYDDSSQNKFLMDFPFNQISSSRNRVLSKGSSLHTMLNFDTFNSQGLVVDGVRRVKVVGGQSDKIQLSPQGAFYSLNNYDYLEFDVGYTLLGKSANIQLLTLHKNNSLTTRNLGSVDQYLTDGNGEMRWHHAIINLNSLGLASSDTEYYYSIIFATASTDPHYILVDNIALSVDPVHTQNTNLNSKDYFCTGGFGTWVNDLDPPSSVDLNDWQSFGPYQFACEAHPAYGWTGAQCCGDDTRFNNYGEHFAGTKGGCFNGTFLNNDESVASAKNIREDRSSFESYAFKDILFYNNTFIGCQLSPGKYGDFKESIDGKTTTNTVLVTRSVNEQCAVVGSYYCMNGAWRKKIVGYRNDVDATSLGISAKGAPSGAELIANGDFAEGR